MKLDLLTNATAVDERSAIPQLYYFLGVIQKKKPDLQYIF
jgi:hypothetical protein